jgi:hypothetical protein
MSFEQSKTMHSSDRRIVSLISIFISLGIIPNYILNIFFYSYPVILDLEMHCQEEGQTRIAEILKEELSGCLFFLFVRNPSKLSLFQVLICFNGL